MNFTNFYHKVEEVAWKVMSQHIFPSLTVAMLTFAFLGSSSTWLSAQSGYCDNPLNELEIVSSPDVSICLGGSTELSVEATGGILSIPRSYAIRVRPGTNRFVKQGLDGSNYVEIDMGTNIAYGAGDFGNGTLYSVDLTNNLLVTIDTTTAAATTVGPIVPAEGNHIWAGLAYDETTNIMYAVSTDTMCSDSSIIYQVNLVTGEAFEAYRLGVNCVLWLGVDPAGIGYVLNATDSSLYSFDLLDGELNLVGNIGTRVNFCQGADFDPVSGILYAALYDFVADETTFTIIDTETAELTPLETVVGEYCVVALKNPGLSELQYSWTPAAGLDDPSSPNPVADPASTTTYTVVVSDVCGNTVSASVTVTVETPFPLDTTISCNMNVQVSVDGNCEAVVTADMILAGHYPCINEFHFVDVDNRGHNLVDINDIGKTLMVKVTRLDTLGNPTGNSCWGSILVEDKLKPTIICTNDTLSCLDGRDYIEPIAFDNCGEVETIVLLNETITPILCDDDFIRVVNREFMAIDSSGNESEPCVQQILLRRVDFNEIELPGNFTLLNDNALLCDQGFPTLPNGHPSPEFTGYPSINGFDLIPGSLDPYCNISATFSDSPLPPINCKEKIIRTWVIREFWCNGHIEIIHTQEIEIVDKEGPEITCPDDITVTTSTSQSCTAGVFIPVPDAVDNCNEVDRIDLQYPGGFQSNWGGGSISLQAGENILTFTAYDNCAPNSSSCSMTVTVVDETPPVPVCKESTVVSLTNDGTARVNAEVFDNGSFDECGIGGFEVSRMDVGCDGELPSFKPYIDFFCCDLADNPIMIVLRVFDTSGNTNECMIEVEVQDKLPPAVTCPPHITVSCQYPFDENDLSVFGSVVILDNLSDLQDPSLDPRNPIIIDDIGNPFEAQPKNWGLDGFAYDNCDVSVTESFVSNIDNCGKGTIVRTFSAIGVDGVVGGQCNQIITFDNFTPFTGNQITWPEDVMVNNGCSALDLTPSVTGQPEFDDDICDLVHFNYSDQVFYINSTSDPACFKIIRTWTVIDWCQFENGQYITWVRDQTIKVVNDVAPTITGNCDEISICSFDPNCGTAFVELTQSAEDDCTPEDELNWRYDIDLDNNGIFDLSSNYNPYANVLNPTDASGNYPLGNHRIVWTVEDGCGNVTTCQQFFTIVNCTPPKAICRNGIAVELMPMDTNGDGTPDTAMLNLPAHLLNAGSHHSCGYDVVFSFSPDPQDNVIALGCDDLGSLFLPMYVTDEYGNQDFCIAHVEVQDNNEVCPSAGGSSGGDDNGIISGLIQMENGNKVKDVEVQLEGAAMGPAMTDQSGNYNFPPMPLGGAYEVVPEKDYGYLDGVTTYDIALMQRHILGIQYFSSPYQWIAADIDNNGVIDVRDVAELRRMILGTIDKFSRNKSWRFVDAAYQFDGFDPLNEDFNETYMIPDFNANMTGLDFIAVKVGDINSSVDPSGLNQGAESRTYAEPLTFRINNRSFERGESIRIDFRAEDFRNVDAFQFTLLFNNNEMRWQGFESGAIDLSDYQVGTSYLNEGMITFSWNDLLPTTLSEGEVLFTLEFEAIEDGWLTGSLNLSSSKTPVIAYTNGEPRPMELNFQTGVPTSGNFELYQNQPNPFRDYTVIGFNMASDANAKITIVDVKGKVVAVIEDYFNRGYNEVKIADIFSWSNGVYYYRLDTEGFSATRKMIIIK